VRLLFTVTDVLSIPGRGVVLLPELTLVAEERLGVGTPLRLRGPDGIESIVPIGGLEFLKSPKRKKCELVIMLRDKKKEDIPIGTEVWSVDRPSE
jgi:hypothetical protein